jgi:hypothetical protein
VSKRRDIVSEREKARDEKEEQEERGRAREGGRGRFTRAHGPCLKLSNKTLAP